MFENKKIKINVSDFQKVSAVTAVMMQTDIELCFGKQPQRNKYSFSWYLLRHR